MTEQDLNNKEDGDRKKRSTPRKKQTLGQKKGKQQKDNAGAIEISGMIHVTRDCLQGTYLEGLFDLSPEEYLDSWEKIRPLEVKIGIMNDFERRIYTLLFHKYRAIAALASVFGLDNHGLNVLLENYDEDLVEKIEKAALDQYEQNEQDFPWEVWAMFINMADQYGMLGYTLDSLVYTRLLPKYYCGEPRYRTGFLIVKDVAQVMEEDGSFEDEEKIAKQNFLNN